MKILFLHEDMPSFAKIDYEILSEKYDAKEFNFKGPSKGYIKVLTQLPSLWKSIKHCCNSE